MGRRHHSRAVVRIPAAGTGVVPCNGEPYPGNALSIVGSGLCREENVGQISSSAKCFGPPCKRHAEPLPGAPIGCGTDGCSQVGSDDWHRGGDQCQAKEPFTLHCMLHDDGSDGDSLGKCLMFGHKTKAFIGL